MEFNELDSIGQEQEEDYRPRPPFRNHRLRRGIYILPSIFTVANLLCGYYAILASFEGTTPSFDYAARAIGLAILFDSFDGFIARATRTSSEFGKQFDSLADVISFGIAPAVLAYAWGVHSAAFASVSPKLHLVQLGWLAGFFFLGCCAWRLARFNIQGMGGGSRYFVGMPTPAAAGIIAACVHAFGAPIEDLRVSILWIVLVVVLGVLMSSQLRYYSFKNVQWGRRQTSLAVVLMALLIGSVVYFSQIVLMLIASVYVIHGLVVQIVRYVRHRTASRAA